MSEHLVEGPTAGPASIRARRDALLRHPIGRVVDGVGALRTFMEHHVFVVWTSMSLVKSVQREVCGTEVPWVPPADRDAARLVHGIVLGEESDLVDGRVTSHFELYLDAMREVGADTAAAERVCAELRRGAPTAAALQCCEGPPAAVAYAREALRLATAPPLHARVAVLAHGSEEPATAVLAALCARLEDRGVACRLLRVFGERRAGLDEGARRAHAVALLERLCRGDAGRIAAAEAAAVDALAALLRLWNALVGRLAAERRAAD